MAKLADVKAKAAAPAPVDNNAGTAPHPDESDPGVESLALEAAGDAPEAREGATKASERPKTATSGAARAKAAPRPGAAKGDPAKALSLGALSVEDEKVNLCYYGKEGTGKTTDALFMAKLGRILVVNAESGLVARRLRKLGVPIENVEIWPNPDTGETITYEGVEELFWRIKGDLLEDPDSWAGTVWDSATEIVSAMLDNVRAAALEKAQRAGKDRDPFFTDLADYGTMTSQMRALLRRFRDLPCHFVLTALERRDQDDDGAVLYGPAVTPALITDIAGFVGIVIHTRVETYEGEDVYIGKTNPGGKYRAKDRFGVLPPLMANPTFDRVVDYVNEKLGRETDPDQQAARERAELAREKAAADKAAGVKKRSAE